MRLRHIELLHAVLSTGSLTGAARLLNISQPAASKALQRAEQQLGFALFTRMHGRLEPTQNAQLLRPQVDTIMQVLHNLQRLAANVASGETHPLRIVSTPTLAHILVPEATTLVRRDFPQTVTELFTQHSVGMHQSLLLHEADIGLTLEETGRQELRHEALCQGQIMVIAPPDWWRASELRKPLPISALAGQSIIGITIQDELGRMLQSHLDQVVPRPQIPVWVQTYELARTLVAQGQGLALVDPFTAYNGSASAVQTRPLKADLSVTLYALCRLDAQLNPVQRRFLEHIRRRAQHMLSGGPHRAEAGAC